MSFAIAILAGNAETRITTTAEHAATMAALVSQEHALLACLKAVHVLIFPNNETLSRVKGRMQREWQGPECFSVTGTSLRSLNLESYVKAIIS